jgi:hypothetical protein
VSLAPVQPAVGEGGGVDAAGELAQVVQHAAELVGGLVQLRGLRAGPGGHRHTGAAAEAQREGDQPLLGAVVQVAFDAAAGGIAGSDDPGAGGDEFGVELGVVQRDGELAGDVAQQAFQIGLVTEIVDYRDLGIGDERRVVERNLDLSVRRSNSPEPAGVAAPCSRGRGNVAGPARFGPEVPDPTQLRQRREIGRYDLVPSRSDMRPDAR